MRKYIMHQTRVGAAGVVATANIRFVVWDTVGGKTSYCTGAAGAATAIKALAKAAGFNVFKCTSENYTGGDSVDISVETELTPEQLEKNALIIQTYGTMGHPEYTHEPRQELLKDICRHFQQGSFDGMTDMYEYRRNGSTVKDPAGDDVTLDSKYIFEHFITKAQHEKWHK